MTATPAPRATHDAPALYDALAREAPAGTAVTTLHIGGSHTTLASGQAGSAPTLLATFELGARVTATLHFASELPLPQELARASEAAQAAFAVQRPHLAGGSTLYTADADIRQVALAAGLQAQPELELELAAVGQLLERLQHPQPGTGAQPEAPALPRQARFAAALVILHAAMQALGFARILIHGDDGA